jgi:TolB protein
MTTAGCPRPLLRRHSVTAVMLVAAAACTETNITNPKVQPITGSSVLFASNRFDNNFEIYRVAATGGDPQRLTVDRVNNDLAPVASYDGKRVAWEKEILAPDGSVTSVEIWVMNIDGTDQHVVVRNGSENRSPSWTAADAGLVYESRAPGNADIFRVPLSGGASVNLTNNPFADQFPRVSPDGTRIIFQSNRNFNFDIYSMNADGTGLRNLTANPGDDRFASWTPSGTQIVWSRFVDSFDLFVMNADGSGQHAVISSPFEETNPSVSPDGTSIVYQTNRFPRSSLDVVSIDGSNARPLTGNSTRASVSDVAPWWTTPAP